ncbi:MAG: sterol desaturase family protein [Pseudomonadales bacterium]|nr:sterol desaturase family protein [Pseudomonadales bacterium]
MLLDVYKILGVILVFAGLLMGLLMWAVNSKAYGKYRIRTPKTYRIPQSRKVINVVLNSTLSLVFLFAIIQTFHGSLFHFGEVKGVTIFGEVIAALLLYDFCYYFMHRGMHHPKAMKFVHGVHHYVRFPTSMESIYLHPVENLAGLGLLMGSIAVLGPISMEAFCIVFFIHSTFNILVHSNLMLPHPAFKFFNFLALKHDLHHGKHLNKNYASLTPFWDLLFGTYA